MVLSWAAVDVGRHQGHRAGDPGPRGVEYVTSGPSKVESQTTLFLRP